MLPPNPQDFHFSSLSLKFPLLALGFQLSDKVQIFVNTKRFQGLRVNQNFDMRCKDVQLVMEVGKEPISSLYFNSGNEDIIYASSGKEVQCFDVHMATS